MVALQPRHPVRDNGKLHAMVEAMLTANGWPDDMPPVLAVGNDALTGVHRLAAAEEAGIEPCIIDIEPVIHDLIERGYIDEYYAWEQLAWLDDGQLASLLRTAGYSEYAQYADHRPV